jgi:hypothetical protein
MQPESTCVHNALAVALCATFALAAVRAGAADDASAGYQAIRPSLVKVWAFDRAGRPMESGSGIVVDSGARHSLILTASHVLAGAASIRIDVSRDLHDVSAHVERTGPRDLTLLGVDCGGLHAARFAPPTRTVVEGNLVAIAGYVKKDELIGIVGQEPRVLFPGTVSSRPENGRYLELENVHVEEGLSGGAVFDPGTGEVLGVVTARTSDGRGGFADSGALVVGPFLEANHIALTAPRAPAPQPLRLVPIALEPLPLRPSATLRAVPAIAAPRPPASGIVSWQVSGAAPKQFTFVENGCRVAVTVDVQTLQFVVAHQALVQPHNHGALLAITLQQRTAQTDACADVADAEPVDGAYDPTAMSFDGRHVTMRLVYAGKPDASDLFPADASLDADLDGDTSIATVQFFDRNWNGSLALPLERTALASITSTW